MVTVIVKYQLPVPASHMEMLDKFKKAEGLFRGLPGLVRKYFCYDSEKHTGHSVYLWEEKKDAEKFFGPEFIEHFKKTFGTAPEWFMVDTLMIIDNAAGDVSTY